MRRPLSPWPLRVIVLAGIGVWLGLRAYQVLFMGLHLSDINLYKEQFDAIFAEGKRPYSEVPFPYPPLALVPLIVLAPFAPLDRLAFVQGFRFEMACAEALVYACIWFGFRRLVPEARSRALLVGFVALCFSLQPHIVLDRLDMVVCLLIIACVPLVLRNGVLPLFMLVLAGMLYKFVPVFFALALAVATAESRRQELLKAVTVILGAASGLVLLSIADRAWWPGLWANLLGHAQRGIQIESLWASMVLAGPALDGTLRASMLEVTYGAAHLRAGLVPDGLLLVAKYGGFALYAIVLLAIRRARQLEVFTLPELVAYALGATWIACAGLQRVLSPQFFLWASVAFAMLLVPRPRRLLLYGAVLLLTYAAFDVFYPVPWSEKLSLFAFSSLLRNILLAALMSLVAWDFFSALRAPRRSAPAPNASP